MESLMALHQSPLGHRLLLATPLVLVIGLGGCNGLPGQFQKSAAPDSVGFEQGQKVGVLLPTKSPRYGKAAGAILDGIQAAKMRDSGSKPVINLMDSSSNAVRAYNRLIEDQNTVVIGPVLPGHVDKVIRTRIEQNAKAPLLALNKPDQSTRDAKGVYRFPLRPEDEAETVAALINNTKSKLTPAVVVYPAGEDGDWGERLHKGFKSKVQGAKTTSISYQDNAILSEQQKDNLKQALDKAKVIFMIAQPKDAVVIFNMLRGESQDIPIIATSHATDDEAQFPKLDGLFYVDIPWLVDPSIRNNFKKNGQINSEYLKGQQARLYALGVDAYSVAARVAKNPSSGITLKDGMTGDLRFDSNGKLVERRVALGRFTTNSQNKVSIEPTTEQILAKEARKAAKDKRWTGAKNEDEA
jgi:outer membrane PBP1 activator LpoA protein